MAKYLETASEKTRKLIESADHTQGIDALKSSNLDMKGMFLGFFMGPKYTFLDISLNEPTKDSKGPQENGMSRKRLLSMADETKHDGKTQIRKNPSIIKPNKTSGIKKLSREDTIDEKHMEAQSRRPSLTNSKPEGSIGLNLHGLLFKFWALKIIF